MASQTGLVRFAFEPAVGCVHADTHDGITWCNAVSDTVTCKQSAETCLVADASDVERLEEVAKKYFNMELNLRG